MSSLAEDRARLIQAVPTAGWAAMSSRSSPPGQSAATANVVRDRLRAQLHVRRAAIRSDVPWDLTIATVAYPADGESFQPLLSGADRRLYAQRGIQLGADI